MLEWFFKLFMTVKLILWKSDNQLSIGFWSIGNYQVNASWVYGIFETGLIFDNIFATVDLTEIFHIGIIWFDIKIAQKNKILILP